MSALSVVVLGLSLSSSWGNGHATTYRALLKGLAALGADIVFLERDQPWYAANRDLVDPDYCTLAFYHSVKDVDRFAKRIAAADLVIVGSYTPDGPAIIDKAQRLTRGALAFYDIDTPVTRAALLRGDCAYLRPEQAAAFDLYFSFTGGPILASLAREFGVRRPIPLYCSVDCARMSPQATAKRWDLSYLGTHAEDRWPALEALLLTPARRNPALRCVVAGPLYPSGVAWPANVDRLEHVAPADHAAFYSASRLTLNLTRAEMRKAGFSPSVRLFEAAAAGAAIATDPWRGIETALAPGRELAVVRNADDVLTLLNAPPERLAALGAAARRRAQRDHTGEARARVVEQAVREARLEAEGAVASG